MRDPPNKVTWEHEGQPTATACQPAHRYSLSACSPPQPACLLTAHRYRLPACSPLQPGCLLTATACQPAHRYCTTCQPAHRYSLPACSPLRYYRVTYYRVPYCRAPYRVLPCTILPCTRPTRLCFCLLGAVCRPSFFASVNQLDCMGFPLGRPCRISRAY